MKKVITIFFKGILVGLLLAIGYLNITLYYSPTFKMNKNKPYNESVYFQLNFLKEALKKEGAGTEMQALYPEGFVFIHALYALTWSDLIEPLTALSEIHEEGIQEMTWALEAIHSPEGKAIFSRNLPLEYGAYYRGWSNYVLGSKLKVQPNNKS